MKRVRRGKRRLRPPPHRDHRPEMVELFSKRKKGKANGNLRLQKWPVSGEAPGTAIDNFRFSPERDQRHNGPDEAYGDGPYAYFKVGVSG
jgi:hypothetical protein